MQSPKRPLSTPAPAIRIGTRGSPLALAQANELKARLQAAHGLSADAVRLDVIRTTGDMVQDRPLSEIGGKGLFTKEIEQALLDGDIDIAVHSTKDMPNALPAGLVLAATLPREDVRDAFISNKAASLAALPAGAVVGTASLRRQALVKRLRPDLSVVPFRGNVGTRIKKLEDGIVDATLLALAGLRRLGLERLVTGVLDVDEFLPAVGQGAICLETREHDARTRALVAALDDQATSVAIRTERAFLAVLDGSCRTPIAGHARVQGNTVSFRGMILKPDGRECYEATRVGGVADALALGQDAGLELKRRGGPGFFSAS